MLTKLYLPLFASDYQETFGDKAEAIVSELYVTQICSFKQQSLSHLSITSSSSIHRSKAN